MSQNEAPSILGNAACWSLHMGLSSNLRYQLLGGADAVRAAAAAADWRWGGKESSGGQWLGAGGGGRRAEGKSCSREKGEGKIVRANTR